MSQVEVKELDLSVEESDFSIHLTDKQKAAAAAAAGGALVTVAVAGEPAEAAGVDDVATMVASLGTLATAALAVVLVPMGLYFAFRIVKRVMSGT